jgi:16S rRNA (guanine527-N7)-methyltransferase
MPTDKQRFKLALQKHASDFAVQLALDEVDRLGRYYELLQKWNPRLHLVAPCSPEEFATRHVLESLLLLPHLTQGAKVTDVGSGGGLPLLPCLIVRGDLNGTLIESSRTKGVFLREACRRLPNAPQLIVKRFEETAAPAADFVTCRALERFQEMLPKLVEWAPPSSTLLLFVGTELREKIEGLLPKADTRLIPGSEKRSLVIARRDELRPNQ